jgi:DNA-binding GntR family transcriptional regulator
MYEGLHDRQVRAGLMALFQAPGRQDSVLAEHKAIVDALAAGNAESVAQAIDNHLEGTLKILLTS